MAVKTNTERGMELFLSLSNSQRDLVNAMMMGMKLAGKVDQKNDQKSEASA